MLELSGKKFYLHFVGAVTNKWITLGDTSAVSTAC